MPITVPAGTFFGLAPPDYVQHQLAMSRVSIASAAYELYTLTVAQVAGAPHRRPPENDYLPFNFTKCGPDRKFKAT